MGILLAPEKNFFSVIFPFLRCHSTMELWSTVEALMNRHRQDAKKVSVTGAGHWQECKKAEFVTTKLV